MDPGVDRHEWESELSALEEQLGESPAETLPELDALVGRMLEQTGVDDPEVVSEFDAAHEITDALEHGNDGISPGDVAAAINGYRAVFDHVITLHSTGAIEPEP